MVYLQGIDFKGRLERNVQYSMLNVQCSSNEENDQYLNIEH
jgi:hypothetical protein